MRSMYTVRQGREAEYTTAMILWGQFGIATLPSANPVADLITVNGTSIEVKQSHSGNWQLNPRQRNKDFCDFLVLWYGNEPFIVPFSPSWLKSLTTKAILLSDVRLYNKRWDLIANFDYQP